MKLSLDSFFLPALKLSSSAPLLLPGIVALALLSACATGPKTGVRASYQHATVGKIAVVPFYSTSTFSLAEHQFQDLVARYEAATTVYLEDMGFEVIGPREFKHHLTEAGVWPEFQDGILLRQSLTRYFEATKTGQNVSIEVLTLQRLASTGTLPTGNLFFGEILYHSEGICHVEATKFSEFAHTTVSSDAPAKMPRPCIVSHFHAKLVDAATGQTMWYNRALREVHSGELDSRQVQANIGSAIQTTLGHEAGLRKLVPATTPNTVQTGARSK